MPHGFSFVQSALFSRAFALCVLFFAVGDSAGAPAEIKHPYARPLTSKTFDRTEKRRARGEYLVEGLLYCFTCHSDRDWSKPGAPPREGRKGAGHIFWERDGERLVAPNLTPDAKTGAGRWTDDMFARAIREGVGHDGRPLSPQMFYASFRALSEEDLASVVVYLRSLPPVPNALPHTKLTKEHSAQIAQSLKPLTTRVSVDASTPEKNGTYLITLADCAGCHSAWEAERMPGIFGGGNLTQLDGHGAFSANLTPHATGLTYNAETFVQVMRTGKWGALSPIMPWIAFSKLSDDDLRAIYAALRKVPPVAHAVANAGPPQWCEVCRQKHPLGSQNQLVQSKGVPVDRAILAQYVGHYQCDEIGDAVEIFQDGDSLKGRDGPMQFDLIATSDSSFLTPGWIAPIRFERDRTGRVVHMIESDIKDYVYVRLH